MNDKNGMKVDEIRVPYYKGIVGACMKKGKIINVKEASSDKRFYGKYDRVTGYTTKSILAVPVLNQYGKTIGVLEAINKNTKEGTFTS